MAALDTSTAETFESFTGGISLKIRAPLWGHWSRWSLCDSAQQFLPLILNYPTLISIAQLQCSLDLAPLQYCWFCHTDETAVAAFTRRSFVLWREMDIWLCIGLGAKSNDKTITFPIPILYLARPSSILNQTGSLVVASSPSMPLPPMQHKHRCKVKIYCR